MGDQYGTRFRGYITAPVTGNYTFWISGDDQCNLFLSPDESVANRRLIARVATWTGFRVWEEPRDGNSALQRSAAIPLVAGRRYYIEALQKEGSGGDSVSVGWQLPTGTLERPIPGRRLSPYQELQTPPKITQQSINLTVEEGANATFDVTAIGGEPISYVWIRDGVRLEGERSASLTLPRVTLEESGSRFQCELSNSYGTILSSEATLTVVPERTRPTLALIHPPQGAALASFREVEIAFSEQVVGVDAGDLLVNGRAATRVTGVGAGPYVFEFDPVATAPTITFAADHLIADVAPEPNGFTAVSWSYVLNPNLAPTNVIISEIAAANENGFLDETGEPQDWIELWNRGATAVNLSGWSLSDDASAPGMWVFPNVSIPAGQRLVVFASGADRRAPASALHTNFKLSVEGEFLGLFSPEAPRTMVSQFDPFPEQRVDHSYGLDAFGQWRYYAVPSPRAANGTSAISHVAPAPEFSVERGFFPSAFELALGSSVAGAEIRYTLDGTEPTLTNSFNYTAPLTIAASSTVRAAVFKTGYLPSRTITHSYLFGVATNRLRLPALSLVTAQKNLTGPTGIIGISGGSYDNSGLWTATRSTDYHNPRFHGLAWERPVSAEYMIPMSNDGWQADAGLRVQGSDYMRPRYKPSSKFSYRLYFRSDYGPGKLDYPLFEGSPVTEFDRLVLRAGHNDETNPFVKDELMRRLFIDTGHVGSHGDFLLLYVNRAYKGYYNVTERIDEQFCQTWHHSENEWDVLAQNRDPLDGDALDFNSMMGFITSSDMTDPGKYRVAAQRLDLTNFVDYLLVNIYGANGDWPHNNWRAGRERVPGALWRYYVWDAEFALGTYGRSSSHNTFTQELAGQSEIARIFQALKRSVEFKQLFADRIHKHFFNGGALTDANVTNRFFQMREQLRPVIPTMDLFIPNTWVKARRNTIFSHFRTQGVWGSTNAPFFSQHGGNVPLGYGLTMRATNAVIYYTTNGVDPRVPFTGAVAPEAQQWSGQSLPLRGSMVVKARGRSGTTWSALAEAAFQVANLTSNLRISEIMFNPPGGSAYEFVELWNSGATPVDLNGYTFGGISFGFSERTVIGPGERVVLASNENPAAFAARYPNVVVSGWYGSNLANGGEKIALKDPSGVEVAAVTYGDAGFWPKNADGGGVSLELIDPNGDSSDSANWRASSAVYGSPGTASEALDGAIQISEVFAPRDDEPGFVELWNKSASSVDLGGWRLVTDHATHTLVMGSILAPGARLVLWTSASASQHLGYPLSPMGGTFLLESSNGDRVDGFTYGAQVDGSSTARDGDAAPYLARPTPGISNEARIVAPHSALRINEVQANSPAGSPDWIELYNSSSEFPLALHGLFLSTPDASARLSLPSFVPAGGHILIYADEDPGAAHVGFKLPAMGVKLSAHDPAGNLIDSIQVPSQAEGASYGRVPDGAASLTTFAPGAPTPGSANFAPGASALQISELMAHNVSAVIDPFGGLADWVELRNESSTSIDLSGYRMAFGSKREEEFIFPQGISIAAGDFLIVWCEPLRPATITATNALNAGVGLGREGDSVALFSSGGAMLDSVQYGRQIANYTIGRVNGVWELLSAPTPGRSNATAAQLGSIISVRFNEWMAASNGSDDWIELFNLDPLPVRLTGAFLTDDPSFAGIEKWQAPGLSFIGPHDWARFTADDGEEGSGEGLTFKLDAMGENLRLYTSLRGLVDAVSYRDALEGVSQGSLPDGDQSHVIDFVESASPEEANYLRLDTVQISKVLTKSVNGEEAGLQIRSFNEGVDLSGWVITDDLAALTKFRFAPGTLLAPHSIRVVRQSELAIPLDRFLPFELHLLEMSAESRATGRKTSISITPAPEGVALRAVGDGMLPAGDAALTESLSIPAAPALRVNEARLGTNKADVGFIEIVNASAQTIRMSAEGDPERRWRLDGAAEFLFPNEASIPPGAHAIVLSVDPMSAEAASFRGTHNVPLDVPIFGPFRPKANEGAIELLQPLDRALPHETWSGFIPMLRSDSASVGRGFSSAVASQSWQKQAGSGWASLPPTPGRPNGIAPMAADADGDRLPDWWETHFRLDAFAANAPGDIDRDGASEFEEFTAGTDPRDGNSVLRAAMGVNSGGPSLRFVSPRAQAYTILKSEDLNAWNEWTNFTTSARAGVIDVNDERASDRQFYQLRVEQGQ